MVIGQEERIYYENRTKPNEWDQVWDAIVANSGNSITADDICHRGQSVEDAQEDLSHQFTYSNKRHNGSYAYAKQDAMHKGSRHNGIRNPSRSACGHRDPGNNDIPSETRRALERDSRWDKQSLTNTYRPGHVDRRSDHKRENPPNAYRLSTRRYKNADVGEDVGKGLSRPFRKSDDIRLHIQDIRNKISHIRTRGKDADAHFRAALMGFRDDTRAQSTVEYAIVMAAGLSIIVALGLLANSVGDGVFIQHAVAAASHNVSVFIGGVVDVFSF